MNSGIIYSDRLVQIAEDYVIFQDYYFPFGSKQVNLSDVDHIEAMKPTLLSGKWRIHGTGDFKTWFPRDWKRHRRDKIFVMHLANTPRRIGFTVENSEKVENIFEQKGLLRPADT